MTQFLKASFAVAVLAALFAWAGCDIGVNPLILDGSAASGSFRVDENLSPPQLFAGSKVVDLSAIWSVSDNIDSVHFYNLTLLIDSTAGTTAGATVSGTISVDTYTIVTLSNVAISAFASERSIFDKTLAGLTVDNSGVNYLVSALRNHTPDSVTLNVSGSTNATSAHFTAHVKVYGQVYAKSK